MGERMKINGITILWFMIATGLLAYAVNLWQTEINNRGYWRGRAVGWDMHRRMITIKKLSDEVFDYEQN
jgi:uncharacterized membrane protein YiaA